MSCKKNRTAQEKHAEVHSTCRRLRARGTPTARSLHGHLRLLRSSRCGSHKRSLGTPIHFLLFIFSLLALVVQLGATAQSSLPVTNIPVEVQNMVARRQQARHKRDCATTKSLMRQLFDMGMQVVDLLGGSTKVTISPSTVERTADTISADKAEGTEEERGRYRHEKKTTGGRTRSCRNKKTNSNHRVRIVRGSAHWLVHTFALNTPSVQTREGTHAHSRQGEVLDVAGGAGTLSWVLAIEHGLRSTVIDPRPVRLSVAKTSAALMRARTCAATLERKHATRQREREWLHPKALLRLAAQEEDWQDRVHKTCVMLHRSCVAQLPCLFTSSLFTPTSDAYTVSPPDEFNVLSCVQKRQAQAPLVCSSYCNGNECTSIVLTNDVTNNAGVNAPDMISNERTAEFEGMLQDENGRVLNGISEKNDAEERDATCESMDDRVRAAWQRCDVVVGLHPDEATHAIVEAVSVGCVIAAGVAFMPISLACARALFLTLRAWACPYNSATLSCSRSRTRACANPFLQPPSPLPTPPSLSPPTPPPLSISRMQYVLFSTLRKPSVHV